MQRNSAALIVAGVIVAAIAGWLAFGFFGIQSAFIDNEVDETGPAFTSGAAEESENSEEFDAAMDEAEANPGVVAEETMPGEIVTVASGAFTGTSRYTVTGDALVLNDGSEQRFLRLEDFETTNGPDLKVYLRADDGNYVNLGELKGNIGDQNYEIPAEVDLGVFSTVEIWCERFSVLFGNAPLA